MVQTIISIYVHRSVGAAFLQKQFFEDFFAKIGTNITKGHSSIARQRLQVVLRDSWKLRNKAAPLRHEVRHLLVRLLLLRRDPVLQEVVIRLQVGMLAHLLLRELVVIAAAGAGLADDVFVVVVPQASAHLLVVHARLVLHVAPFLRHALRVLEAELPAVAGPAQHVLRLQVLQLAQDEVPQLDLPVGIAADAVICARDREDFFGIRRCSAIYEKGAKSCYSQYHDST